MVKAKDFIDYLCEDLEYRFFSGVACREFKSIYDSMTPEKMHYIPANTEKTALNLANGVSFTGFKSCILIKASKLFDLVNDLNNFNIEYNLPILILAQDNINNQQKKILAEVIDFESFNIMKNYERIKDMGRGVGIVFIREGVLE